MFSHFNRLVSGVPFSDMVTMSAMKALELAMELFDEGNMTAEDCIVIAKEVRKGLALLDHSTSCPPLLFYCTGYSTFDCNSWNIS